MNKEDWYRTYRAYRLLENSGAYKYLLKTHPRIYQLRTAEDPLYAKSYKYPWEVGEYIRLHWQGDYGRYRKLVNLGAVDYAARIYPEIHKLRTSKDPLGDEPEVFIVRYEGITL